MSKSSRIIATVPTPEPTATRQRRTTRTPATVCPSPSQAPLGGYTAGSNRRQERLHFRMAASSLVVTAAGGDFVSWRGAAGGLTMYISTRGAS